MNIKKLLRSTRLAQRTTFIATRPDDDLTFFKDLPEKGDSIIFDTCVYIDHLQGRFPANIVDRISGRSVYHSSMALSELVFSFGHLDPNDPRTQKNINLVKNYLSLIPDQKLLTPLPETMMRGAILAGSITRILKQNEENRRKGLIDAMIATHVSQDNLRLITRNIVDFDRLSQLDKKLKVAFYRI